MDQHEMGDRLRYGIIGAGDMGCEHIRFLQHIPEAEIVAIADPDAGSRAAAASLAAPDTRLFEDYRALIAEAPVDAFIIATPNYTHIDVLHDVVGTGKHILVEKPLCTTLADCRTAAAAAENHAGVFWVAMEYRYMPPVARLIEEVRGGTIGRLRMLAIREHRNPFLVKVGDWNRLSRNTGGTMVEKCCHYFDLMRLIVAARPRRVYASGGQDVNHLDEVYGGERADMIDNAYTVVDFDNGVRAMLDLCMFADASPDQDQVVAVGDQGKIEAGVPSSTVAICRRPDRVETIHSPVPDTLLSAGAHHGSTYYEHLCFLRAVRDGRRPDVTAHDGLMAVAMGLAAETSISEGRTVEMSELGV